jgi:hypothetical protein
MISGRQKALKRKEKGLAEAAQAVRVPQPVRVQKVRKPEAAAEPAPDSKAVRCPLPEDCPKKALTTPALPQFMKLLI